MVKDSEFDKLLNKVDNETLNIDLEETKVSAVVSPMSSMSMVSAVVSPMSKSQVAVTLAREATEYGRLGRFIPGTNSHNYK